MGAPLESLLRLVLGDKDVSDALVIDIITDQTQYSCYLYFRYTDNHAGIWHMVCGTKCYTEQSVTQHTWWGPPLESVGATSRTYIAGCWHDGGILSALVIQT